MHMVIICFFRKGASTDMQYGLLGSTRDLMWPWPEVEIWHWLFNVNMYVYKAFRREEHDAAKVMPLAFLVQNLFAKKTFLQSALFLPFLTHSADANSHKTRKIAISSFCTFLGSFLRRVQWRHFQNPEKWRSPGERYELVRSSFWIG